MALVQRNTGDVIQASDINTIYELLKTTNAKEWITFTHKGADIASAGTLSLGSDGNYFDVTGTTGITAISSRQAGTMVILQFDGAVTLTHSASLVLQGAANVTTAAGDILVFIADSTTVWRQVGWLTASGFVTLTGTETLTNKTLTSPTIANFTNAAHDHGDADDGGTLVAAAVNNLTLTGMVLTAPTIADFTNAAHDHGDADDGGSIIAAASGRATITADITYDYGVSAGAYVAATGLSVAITPNGTRSVIIIFAGTVYNGAATDKTSFALYKDGANVSTSDALVAQTSTAAGTLGRAPVGFVWRDATPTNASHTYAVYWKNDGNVSTLDGADPNSSLVVFEV